MLLPAASRCFLLLPAASCCFLLLPAASCCFLLLSATFCFLLLLLLRLLLIYHNSIQLHTTPYNSIQLLHTMLWRSFLCSQLCGVKKFPHLFKAKPSLYRGHDYNEARTRTQVRATCGNTNKQIHVHTVFVHKITVIIAYDVKLLFCVRKSVRAFFSPI